MKKTLIRVILTKYMVFTALDETIHYEGLYFGDTSNRFDDRATDEAKSVGFSLACSCNDVSLSVVDLTNKELDSLEALQYLKEYQKENL